MTQDEEIISSISYVDSDFRSIYPELLDTAKKLTNKWDPSLSNESDPGNILIKEAAIVGDKVNYHIDKNVLECFPLSATQQSSARQIYDLVGYNMHWYQSAKGNVTFRLLKPLTSIDENLGPITIKAGTVVCDSTGEYVYTLLEPIQYISQVNTIYKGPAIQGVINPYDINGEKVITLDNLDDNLRIYFPQNLIAENGIYVYNLNGNPETQGFDNNTLDSSSSNWKLVDNLAKYPAGSKVFKFGLDLNTDNCYIQFPEDISSSDLIGNGLNIYYTTTLGQSGNLKAQIINKFLSDYPVKLTGDDTGSVVINDYMAISNTATIGGTDPETLQEAYRNYKKLIGTYDTLVTRRDYENAIYKLPNETNTDSLVSNALVTDRTTDMNYSQKVIQTNLDTDYAKNYVVKSDDTDIMSSYDIILYLLKKPESMLSIEDYNKSFEGNLNDTTKITIEEDLEDVKSVQHNIYYIPEINADKQASELYFDINNVCRLNGTLTTYYQVTSKEAKEIESNVILALITKYNSREIDFGNELDYNDLIATIKNADDRIRNLSLYTPSYEPIMQFADGSLKSLYNNSNTDINNETVAKMVLAGKVQLFSFQDDFQYDFGQMNGEITTNLETISTLNPIEIHTETEQDAELINALDNTNSTLLDQNDIIQIVTPNLITTDTFEATVEYSSDFAVSAGEVCRIPNDKHLKLVYLNTATNTKQAKVLVGSATNNILVKPVNISLTVMNNDDWTNSTTFTNNGSAIIKSNQSIEILDKSVITILEKTPYYVVTRDTTTNDGYYTLELSYDNDRILEENEYIMYTNSNMDGLVILGSGTTLRLKNPGPNQQLTSPILKLSEVLSTEVSEAKSKWNTLVVDISAQENTILNLTEGDRVTAIADEAIPACGNNLITVNDTSVDGKGFLYQLKDETSASRVLAPTNTTDSYYPIKYRSNMILSGNAIVPQKIVNAQEVIIGTHTYKVESGVNPYLLYNYPMNMSGGNNINVQILNENTGEYESLLAVYKYTSGNPTDINDGPTRENGILTIDASEVAVPADGCTLNFTFNKTEEGAFLYKYYLIPASFIIPSGESVTLTVPAGLLIDEFINIYSPTTGYTPSNQLTVTETGNKILVIENSTNNPANNINLKFSTTQNSNVSFGYIQQITGVNSEEIDSENIAGNYYSYSISSQFTDVMNKIKNILNSISSEANYDWAYKVPAENKVIKPISGESYFNTNHIYNKCTIAKIDFDQSAIKVNPSNIK